VKALRALAVLAASGFILAASPAPNWNTTVAENTGAHRLGNPQAEHTLIEFVSYTCPHCATFEQQSEGALKMLFVHPGTMQVEVRHTVRDVVDLTAAMLTRCGPADKFFGNHTAMMLAQPEWFAKGRALSDAQTARWRTGDMGSRRRAIAQDLGLTDIMLARGYDLPQINACLTDDAAAQAILAQSQADAQTYGVKSTPSFVLDGELLEGTHGWAQLSQVLTQLDQ